MSHQSRATRKERRRITATLHITKAQHCLFSLSLWLLRVHSSVFQLVAESRLLGIANNFHRHTVGLQFFNHDQIGRAGLGMMTSHEAFWGNLAQARRRGAADFGRAGAAAAKRTTCPLLKMAGWLADFDRAGDAIFGVGPRNR